MTIEVVNTPPYFFPSGTILSKNPFTPLMIGRIPASKSFKTVSVNNSNSSKKWIQKKYMKTYKSKRYLMGKLYIVIIYKCIAVSHKENKLTAAPASAFSLLSEF